MSSPVDVPDLEQEESISPTQLPEPVDLASLETPLVYFGHAFIKVVGLRHYQGTIHAGEMIRLIREPQNPYDVNAIRVDNLEGYQIGHVNRYSAVDLASILDETQGKVRVDAMTPRAPRAKANGTIYDVMVLMDFYGDLNMIDLFEGRLKKLNMVKSEALGGQAAQKDKVRTRREVWKRELDSQEEIDRLCDRIADDVRDLDFVMEGEDWPLKATLYPHQRQGIAWMLKKERQSDTDLSPLWKQVEERGRTVYYSHVTNSSYKEHPKPVRGGLLADDMGLGKTLQIIGLILANPETTCPWTVRVVSGKSIKKGEGRATGKVIAPPRKQMGREQSSAAERGRKTTLVICPLSVLHNWCEQIKSHTRPEALAIYVYYGSSRQTDPLTLEQFDIVIATYSTLASEWSDDQIGQDGSRPAKRRKKRSKGLLSCRFWRVVLDEAHQIRNASTKTAKAVKSLNAMNRWALTGTPVLNKLRDMGSLLGFLQVEPLTDMKVFSQAVIRPIERGEANGLSRLRAVVTSVCLRRTKDNVPGLSSSLPQKTAELVRVEMTRRQRELYEMYFNAAKAAFTGFMRSDSALMWKSFGSILEVILRLRQMCCAPSLVPPRLFDAAREVLDKVRVQDKNGKITSEQAMELFNILAGRLKSEEDRYCCICFEEVTESTARINKLCKHSVCSECVVNLFRTSFGKVTCPLCRGPCERSDLITVGELKRYRSTENKEVKKGDPEKKGDETDKSGLESGAKVLALMKELHSVPPGGKTVVFSQFARYLNVIEEKLAAEGWTAGQDYQLLDGKSSFAQRKAALGQFKDDDRCRLFLISLKAGGMGLNLTSANRVILLDSWWNSATEEQAVDRIHRIGQTRNVRVVRFIADSSIEELVLELQERKQLLSKAALSKLSAEEQRKARLERFIRLFEYNTES